MGVYWLTKASEQGNIEATEILQKCLETGHGITDHNYYDAKCCLEMSQDEKLARRAARGLFTSLSKGEDFVTVDQLQKQLSNVRLRSRSSSEDSIDSEKSDESRDDRDTNQQQQQQKSLEYGGSLDDYRGEKITEAALVSAASSYARGLLPTVSRALCMIDPTQLELNNIPLLQRPFVHPIASLKSLYDWFIERIGGRGGNYLKSLFTSNIQTLLLLIIYSLFGTESIVLFIPMVAYYISFIIMVISTFQMLHSKRELNNFKNWSGLFISYSGGNLNPEEAEYQFCRNNLKPYGHFFLSLLVNLMIYPIIAQQWTPQSEFTLIAFVLTSLTLFNFSLKDCRYPDVWVLFSTAVHVLAKYPYETDIVVGQTWRFLDIRVPTFASYFVGNGIEFCLNFRAVFYLLIPAVFVKIASREKWKGTYKTLIPHCVTLSWWQIAILSSQGATWYGLIRGALALVGLVLFLPIAGLASILLPIVAAAKYLSDSNLTVKIIVTTLLGGLPFFGSWLLKKTRISKFNWIITFLQVILGLIAVVFLSWPISADFRSNDDTTELNKNEFALSWEQYQNHCHQPAWEELSNKAQVQVQCAQLEGTKVAWEGYVTNIRLKSIENNVDNFLKKLPKSIDKKLACVFGETMDQDYCKNSETRRSGFCNMIDKMKKQNQHCHLFHWNRYEFEINVKMKNGIWGNKAEIVLIGDHSFTNFSLHIYPGDQIRFSGILTNFKLENESLLGGSKPHVYLEDIGCLVCHTIDLKSYKRQARFNITINLLWQTLVIGLKTVLNFLLNPLVVFK